MQLSANSEDIPFGISAGAPIVRENAPEKGTGLVHLLGFAQSFGLFVVVCLATALMLGAAVVVLAGMERATLTARVSRPTVRRVAEDDAPKRSGCNY